MFNPISSAGKGKLDVVFLLDGSGSIHYERFPKLLYFIGDIVNSLDIASDRTRVGMGYWSDNAHVNFYLDDYYTRENIIEAVMRTPFLGQKTHTSAALEMLYNTMFTRENGDRDDADNIAIVITDGNSNIQPEKTMDEAINAKVAGIRMMVVSVGKSFVNYRELEAIASIPEDKNMFNVDTYDDLSKIVYQLVKATTDGEFRAMRISYEDQLSHELILVPFSSFFCS